MTQQIIIHTDGACRGNPGIGGWAAIINNNNICQEIYGCELNTTNNRMELRGVIEALKTLQKPHNITVYTDSQYVQKGMSLWIINWKIKAWKNVKNPDLWQELDALSTQHNIKWEWVRGHSGDEMNERADMLANKAIDEYNENYTRKTKCNSENAPLSQPSLFD